MSQGPRLQVEPFQTADSSQTSYAVINEESGAIAIDYSQYYERMATALETLATLSSTTCTVISYRGTASCRRRRVSQPGCRRVKVTPGAKARMMMAVEKEMMLFIE